MDTWRQNLRTKSLGILLPLLILSAGANGQPSSFLRCESIQFQLRGSDEQRFVDACNTTKRILVRILTTNQAVATACDGKDDANVLKLFDLGLRLASDHETTRDKGIAIAQDDPGQPGLIALIRGYAELAVDTQDTVAETALLVADDALTKGCLSIADLSYRYVLRSFNQDRYAAARQRAQVGIDDVRSKRK